MWPKPNHYLIHTHTHERACDRQKKGKKHTVRLTSSSTIQNILKMNSKKPFILLKRINISHDWEINSRSLTRSLASSFQQNQVVGVCVVYGCFCKRKIDCIDHIHFAKFYVYNVYLCFTLPLLFSVCISVQEYVVLAVYCVQMTTHFNIYIPCTTSRWREWLNR